MTYFIGSAAPESLYRYADKSLDIDQELISTANRLSSVLERFELSCTEYRVDVFYLVESLRSYVRLSDDLGHWVRQVGVGFERADSSFWYNVFSSYLTPLGWFEQGEYISDGLEGLERSPVGGVIGELVENWFLDQYVTGKKAISWLDREVFSPVASTISAAWGWVEDHRDTVAIEAAVVAAGALTIATAGAASPLLVAAVGAASAGSTTMLINAASSNPIFDGFLRNTVLQERL